MNAVILHPETRKEIPKEILGFNIMVSDAVPKNEVIIATEKECFKLTLASPPKPRDLS